MIPLHQRVLPVNRCYTSTCHSLCSDQLTYDIEICYKWGFVFFPLFRLHHPALQCTKDLFCRNGGSRKWLPVWIAHVKVLPRLVIPKPRLKPVKARWSHLKANTSVTKDADTEQQQLATNVAATGMTLQSSMKICIHTCIYIVHIQLKIEYLNLELDKWSIFGNSECEHIDFWFFSMQGHVETPLETTLEWASVHSNPFHKQGLDFDFSPSLLLKSFYFVEILKSPSWWRKTCFYCLLWKPKQYPFPNSCCSSEIVIIFCKMKQLQQRRMKDI